MALVKISELIAAGTLTGTEAYPLVQNGNTKKASPDPPGTFADNPTPGTARTAVVAGDVDQTVAGEKRWSDLGHFDAKVRFKRHPLIDICHPDFGGDDSGATDNTAAWDALMLECVGSADPATTVRRCKGIPYLGDGTFRFDSPIKARSVLGFRMEGAGPENTRIRFFGTHAAGLDLNGIAHGVIGGFTIESDAAANITEAVKLWFDSTGGSPTQSARSTTQNTLHHISVTNCVGAVGIRIGSDGTSNQVDHTKLDHCHVRGGWSSGETSLYQAALVVGSGVAGNNLIHNAYHCTWLRYRRLIHMKASMFGMWGGSFSNAESDIYFEGAAGPYFVVRGIRSEESERLLTFSGGTTAPANISIEDLMWEASLINADGRWIDIAHGGYVGLKNVRIHNQGGGVVPKIYSVPAKPLTLAVDGLTTQQTFASAFDLSSGVSLRLRGHTEIDSSKAVVTTTPVFPSVGTVATARKSADQGVVDATQTVLTDMTASISANETVEFEAIVYYDVPSTSDARFSVTVPAGATVTYGVHGLSSTATTNQGDVAAPVVTASGGVLNVGGARAAGAAASKVMAVIRGSVVNGATAGNVNVRGSKVVNTDTTTPADDLTVYAGSHLRLVRY